MKRLQLLIALAFSFGINLQAQTITIGTVSTTVCAGASISVPYTITGSFTAGNVFTAQLSNSAGLFTSPVAIGTLTSTAAGTITATIPSSTAQGLGYRIRVVSSTPAITGTSNPTNITVNVLPTTPTITAGGATTFCSGGSVVLTGATTSGNALDFDGSTDFVNVPSSTSPFTGNADHTIEFNVLYKGGQTGDRWLLWYGTAGVANNLEVIGYDGETGKIKIHHVSTGNDKTATTAALPSNVWTHVALVYTGSSRTMDIYINGVYTETFTFTVNLAIPANAQIQLGTYASNADGVYFSCKMTLDEVRIWNATRTQSQIQANMNKELVGTESNLKLYYNFNQGTAAGTNTSVTTLTDKTTSGYTGTLNNFALTGATSNWVQGFPLEGASWLWSNGSSTQAITATTSANYTVQVTNASGCQSAASAATVVTVNALPTITASATTTAVCQSTSAQNIYLAYSATTNSPTTYSIGGTYEILPTSPITIAVPANTAAGTYPGTLTVKNANGCVSTGTNFNATINTVPTITASATATAVCQSTSAQNTSLAYSATTNTPTTYSISWTATPTNSFVAVTDATLTTSPISIAVPANTAAGTYTGTLTVKNANRCVSAGTSFTLTVSPASVGGTISGSASVCTGTNSTALTLSGHTGSITKWQSSTSSTFASAVTDVANTTTTLTATNLIATTYYRAVITSGACAAANSATATITVSPASLGGTVSGSASVCTGTNSTALTLSGHTGSITKWQSSTSSTFASAVTDVANTTTTLTATNLTATTYYRAVLTSGACAAANSATATVTVSPASVGGSISGSASVCTGTNSTALTLSGHIGSITKWQSSSSSTFASAVTDVANTTTTLTATNLSATTYYRAVITSGACAAANSATATVTVSTASVGGTIAGSASVCTGTNSTALTLSGHTGSITKWQSSTSSTFASAVTDVANTTTTLTATNLSATNYYRAVITSGACAAANSANATVTVSPASLGGTISGSASVCTGTNSATLTLSGYTGSITKWQSSTSSTFASAVTDVANTSTTLTATNLSATTYYRAVITSGACTAANSATATLTVNALPTTPTITAGGATTFCSGGSVTLNGVNETLGNGLDFDGSNDFINVPSSASPYTGNADHTIEFKVFYKGGQTGDRWLAWYGTAGVANALEVIGYNGVTGKLKIHHLSAGNDITATTAALTPNVWTHVALVYTGSGKTTAIYINGVLVETFTYTANLAIPTNSQLQIGTYASVADGVNFSCKMTVEEFRIWDVVRTQSQIQAKMNTELVGTESNLKLYYNFNQGTASVDNTSITTLTNQTTIGYIGTLNNFGLTGATSNWVEGISLTEASWIWSNGATTPFIYATNAGNYTVQVTNNGCQSAPSAVTVVTTVNSLTTLSAIAGGAAYVCVNATTPAFTNAQAGGTLSIVAGTGSASVSTSGVVTGLSAGTVSVVYTYDNGTCSGSVNSSLTVNALPNINTSATATVVCQSTAAQNTSLAYSATTGTPTTYSISWSGSPTNSFVAVTDALLPTSPITIAVQANTAAATYTGMLMVKKDNGCVSAGTSFTVTVDALPSSPTIIAGGSTTFCSGGSVVLNGTTNSIGNALDFDGSNDYVQAPIDIWFTGNYTIETWIYPRTFSSWARVIDFGKAAGMSNVLLAYTEGTSGKPSLVNFNSQSNTGSLTSSTQLELNKWSHLAVSFNGTTANMYINGVLVATGPMSAPDYITREISLIGKSNWPDPTANAIFDELRIWNVARSQAEI